jgi:predicted phage-related endonuclease
MNDTAQEPIDAEYAVLPDGVTATDYRDLDAWLAARRTFVGASESPTLCGVGYASQSPFSLWQQKVTGQEEAIDSELLECGQVLQPAIMQLASRRLELEIIEPGPFTVFRHADYPHLGATLDGLAMDNGTLCAVEAKNVGGYNAAEWQGEEPPLRVNVQLQHQMLAAGLPWGYGVGLLGGNRVICRRVERSERFLAVLLARTEEFWVYVETKTPPPIDGSEATAAALRRLHPSANGETITLPLEAEKWDRALQKAKARIKRWEALKKESENRLKAAIGPAEVGLLPDGGMYTYKDQVTNYKAREAKTVTSRVLRRKGN